MKLLKILGALVGLLVLFVIAGASYISVRGIPSYEPGNIEYQATTSPEIILRGKKLTRMLCYGCHGNNETGIMSGRRMTDAPAEFGTIYIPNITQDPNSKMAGYTDGELLYLLRTGIKRDGGYAPPWMAKLPNMSDDDINAIIAFMRSNDKMVAPDPTVQGEIEPSFLSKFLCNVAFKPFPYPEGPIPEPNREDPVELGRYLAVNLDCFVCHSADYKTNDYLNPEKSVGYFGGGNLPLNMDGNPVPTQNLTPHLENGIGRWSKKKFVRAVRFGIKEGEAALQYPMVPYSLLTEEEAGAIYEYLMTIPAIDNKVDRIVY